MILFRQANRAVPLWELRREMGNILDRFSGEMERGLLGHTRAFPAMNVWEDAEHIYVEAEIPAVSREGLEIYASGNELTIKGQRKTLEGENLTYHRRERDIGEFSRTITLPVEIDSDRVKATLTDGVLLITLPKAEEAKVRKIAVKAG